MRHVRKMLLVLGIFGAGMQAVQADSSTRAPRVEQKPSPEKEGASANSVLTREEDDKNILTVHGQEYSAPEKDEAHNQSLVIPLNTDDIAHGYSIDEPGYYRVSDSFDAANLNDAAAVIFIRASNVVLDLNHHTIIQTTKENSIDGIVVAEGFTNVLIKNGKITGLQGNGISLGNHVHDVMIKGVVISDCAENGIVSEGETTLRNQDIVIFNTECKKNRGCGALFVQNDNVKIYHSVFNGNAIAGVACSNGKSYEIVASTFCDNSGTIVHGLALNNIDSSMVNNCSFNANDSTEGCSHGLMVNGNGNVIENCIANNNAASSSAAHGTGFYVHPKSHNCYLKKCTAIANSQTGFENGAEYGANLFLNNVSFGHGLAGNYRGEGIGYIVMGIAAQQARAHDTYGFDNISIV